LRKFYHSITEFYYNIRTCCYVCLWHITGRRSDKSDAQDYSTVVSSRRH